MTSYRFRRRAFLGALGGGLGLKLILRNLEASAQGMKSPPRLLISHWPVGIVAGANDALWKPTSGSVGGSPALKPFADAGLGGDMTVFRGISTGALLAPSGTGGSEGAVVMLMTAQAPGGVRTGCCEGDDAYAAPGGSVDQLMLDNVATLRRPGGYANSICDSRTDFGELGSRCLSYSTTTDTVIKWVNMGTGVQAKPLPPVLSPLDQYANLFGTMVPGGGGAAGAGGAGGGRPVADSMMRRLVRRKSVLDFAVEELNQMKALAPVSARAKLDIHVTEISKAEQSVRAAIDQGLPTIGTGQGGAGGGTGGSAPLACGTTCAAKPAMQPATALGKADANPAIGTGNNYAENNNAAKEDDAPVHMAAGKAHLDLLKAAFVCDLIRVGTFQWSPSTNHVGFALYPGTTQPFLHHPTSHRIGSQDTWIGSTPADLGDPARFLYNVQLWYFAQQAQNLATWKTTVDGCGNPLLDSTVAPFLTEVAATGHERSNMPGMIIGGKALGFVHNIYRNGPLPIGDFWATVGQAFGQPSGGVFGTPVAGLWTKPV